MSGVEGNLSIEVRELRAEVERLESRITGSRSIGDKFREEGCPYRIAKTQCALEGGESCRRSVCKLPLD